MIKNIDGYLRELKDKDGRMLWGFIDQYRNFYELEENDLIFLYEKGKGSQIESEIVIKKHYLNPFGDSNEKRLFDYYKYYNIVWLPKNIINIILNDFCRLHRWSDMFFEGREVKIIREINDRTTEDIIEPLIL